MNPQTPREIPQDNWRATFHRDSGLVKVESKERVIFDGFRGEARNAVLAAAAPKMLRALASLHTYSAAYGIPAEDIDGQAAANSAIFEAQKVLDEVFEGMENARNA